MFANGRSILRYRTYIAVLCCWVKRLLWSCLPRLTGSLQPYWAQQPAQGCEGCVPYRILIVDDSALIRNSIRMAIERQTHWRVCGEAENGEIAVQKVSELNPTLVILDFQMPVMDGLEAARQISRIAPTLPILMFTMHRSEQLETAAKGVGIACLVSKSSGTLDDLISSVSNILQELSGRTDNEGRISRQESSCSIALRSISICSWTVISAALISESKVPAVSPLSDAESAAKIRRGVALSRLTIGAGMAVAAVLVVVYVLS